MAAFNFKKPDETIGAAMVCEGRDCGKKTRVIHITKDHRKLCDTCYKNKPKKKKKNTAVWCSVCNKFVPATPRTICCLLCHNQAELRRDNNG